LLEEVSTRKFHIEYHGYLSNHITHALFALKRLGASSATTRQFLEHYATRLEPSELHNGTVSPQVPVMSLLGTRKGFYRILDYYDKKVSTAASLNKCVAQEFFPILSKGLVGSAFHALIQTGYGFAAGSPKITAEGLAYLHFTHLPINWGNDNISGQLTKGHVTLDELLLEVQQDTTYLRRVQEESTAPQILSMNIGQFQRRIYVQVRNNGDWLASRVSQVALPPHFLETNMEPKSVSMRLREISKFVVDMALVVYSRAETRNDFFLLHGVTGAWALHQLMLSAENFSHGLDAIRSFLGAWMATYVAQEAPALLPAEAFREGDGRGWKEIIASSLSLEPDEHILKLVQVCHDMSVDNAEEDVFYQNCAKVAIDYPLVRKAYNKERQ